MWPTKTNASYEELTRDLRREEFEDRLFLEMPRALAEVWDAVIEHERSYPPAQIAEFESMIADEVRLCWGQDATTEFDRIFRSIVARAGDGREMELVTGHIATPVVGP